MPKFITIGYGDEAGYQLAAKPVREAAHAAVTERVCEGDLMRNAGKPVQVRNHYDAKVEVTRGAFLSADLPVAWFPLIEAADLSTAIAIAANSPCAVAQGVVEMLVAHPSPISRVEVARPWNALAGRSQRGGWSTLYSRTAAS